MNYITRSILDSLNNIWSTKKIEVAWKECSTQRFTIPALGSEFAAAMLLHWSVWVGLQFQPAAGDLLVRAWRLYCVVKMRENKMLLVRLVLFRKGKEKTCIKWLQSRSVNIPVLSWRFFFNADNAGYQLLTPTAFSKSQLSRVWASLQNSAPIAWSLQWSCWWPLVVDWFRNATCSLRWIWPKKQKHP